MVLLCVLNKKLMITKKYFKWGEFKLNFLIIVETIAILLVLYSIAMILLNKFDNVLINNTLNDNIINLMNEERYTKKTQGNIKLILVIRNLMFILGIVTMVHSNIDWLIIAIVPLVLLAIRGLVNKYILKLLERDYMDLEK